ncbi:histidine kinase [Nonlabens xiamenensis]|uniref:histidine kinase n=1 Tax=Nonlabens xiamenensis TaxID=2341043 RepID=UPI000F6138AF|nr:histidine kinase [Nonlabens xiamenensis]
MIKQLLILILCLCSLNAVAQNNASVPNRTEGTTMILEGRVVTEDGRPISGADVEGRNGQYTSTNALGYFKLPANMGDEVTVRGLDFETVYYRINSYDDIEIRVVDEEQDKKNLAGLSYATAMDSASLYLKKDAEKTADFLIAALSNNPKSLSPDQEARAYEKLGDLYMYNAQYDLAVDNFGLAIEKSRSPELQLKKAEALRANGNYQQAIGLYQSIGGLTPAKELQRLKGLASSQQKSNKNQQALNSFQKALNKAEEIGDTAQATALNASIANLLNEMGRIEEAENFYNNAIIKSKSQSPVANAITQSATADFYNSNNQYDKEIALRKMNIYLLDSLDMQNNTRTSDRLKAQESNVVIESDMDDIEIAEEILATEPAANTEKKSSANFADNELDPKVLSKQKEQLKIAEALKAQNKLREAMNYYETSLSEAESQGDLEVKKDAAFALYNLNKENGNASKALAYNEIYTNALNALFEEKERQLEVASRKSRELLNKQTRVLTLEKDRELTENKLALISTERELSQQVNQRQRWVIYSLVALSLLLIALAYWMYRANQQQRINNRLLALKSLKSQMNPHFIFNALNSVNSYIAKNDERAANKYLADFSKLMRSVLENSELDFISLEKEVELIGLYLKLEHERFKDKFDYQLQVDPALAQANLQVPPMLLQPIIENAVWHGLRYKEEKGQLQIKMEPLAAATGRPTDHGIYVKIVDDGIGREKSKAIKTKHQKKRDSKGLGNIKNRVALLNALHDCDIQMQVGDAGLSPDVGTQVELWIKCPKQEVNLKP